MDCRATPGGFEFDLANQRASPILRQAQDERTEVLGDEQFWQLFGWLPAG
jgi:hypothetical protein